MPTEGAETRLARSAFALFAENGYEQTTVDEIAARAGVGRTTFFRYFRSKDDVIFPDHEALLAQVNLRLNSSADADALAAVCDAVRVVLAQYVSDPEVARQRYALTSTVPALRDRELVAGARYQRVFREHLTRWTGTTPRGRLHAEVVAAAVVAAHNQVLRRWLRGEVAGDPVAELDDALAFVRETLGARPGTVGTASVLVVGVSGNESVDSVVERVRRSLDP